MPKDLIPLEYVNGERRVDSRIIAKELSIGHAYLVEVIKDYKNDFEEFGVIWFETGKPKKKSKGGRPEIFCFLNRDQAHLYLTYSKNTLEARQLKKKLVRTFAYYEKALMRQYKRQGELAWKVARAEGKIIRREETDIIKEFVEYATLQGSKSAKMYYVTLSKLVNKNLFLNYLEIALQKPKNFRDLLSHMQLVHLQVADDIVRETLKDGMEEGLFYKDIYKLAKENVENFAKTIKVRDVLPGGHEELQLTE
jgi:phage regulator Rha-like protein